MIGTKPCPFCKYENTTSCGDTKNKRYWLACAKCGALGPNKRTPPEAVKAWNRRPREKKAIATHMQPIPDNLSMEAGRA